MNIVSQKSWNVCRLNVTAQQWRRVRERAERFGGKFRHVREEQTLFKSSHRLQLQTATMAAEENAGSLMDGDVKYLRCWACSFLNGGCSLFLFDFVKIATAAK